MTEIERILTACEKTKAKAIRENRIALWGKSRRETKIQMLNTIPMLTNKDHTGQLVLW